jgi:hypothetical protein
MPTTLADCAQASDDASRLATHSRSDLNDVFESPKMKLRSQRPSLNSNG